MQLCIVIGALGLSFAEPALSLTMVILWSTFIAASAATMDVAIDGYRIDIVANETEKLPAAAAMSVAGWWTGYSLPGFAAFF